MKNLFLTLSVFLFSLVGLSQTVVFGVMNVNMGTFDPDGYIVTPGGELYFNNGTYSFNPGKGIEVLTHGYLQLHGPNITLNCNDPFGYWDGITIYADPNPYSSSNSTPENWGMQVESNFIIARAETGIHMRYEMASYAGGIVIGGNGYARSIRSFNGNNVCQFVDNYRYDIRVINDVIAKNYSASNGSTPTEWKNYKFTSSSTGFIMSMEFVNTILATEISNFKISSPAEGIYLSNSNATILDSEIYATQPSASGIIHRISTSNPNNNTPTIIKSCIIEAYKYGIYSRHSENLYVAGNEMRANDYCIYLKYTLGTQLSYNDIRGSHYGIEINTCKETFVVGNVCVSHDVKDIYMVNCYDTKLTGNQIGWGTIFSDEGMHVRNCENTRIIRNLFKKSQRSIYFTGLNPLVKIHCNTFYDPSGPIDAAIRIDDNPINDQGNISDGGANNYFSALPATFIRVRNNNTPLLTFTNSFAIAGNFPSVNTNFNINTAYNANCNVPRLAQPTDVETAEIIPTPNPFTDIITLNENVNSVQIFSISGQHIQTIRVEGTEVNLGHLDMGTYIMLVEDATGKTSRHKVIKQ